MPEENVQPSPQPEVKPNQPPQAVPSSQEKTPQKKSKLPIILVSIIALILILFAGAWWFVSRANPATSNQTGKTSAVYKGKIVIGYVTWPGYLGLFLARDKGYFKDAGLDIEMHLYPGLDTLAKDYSSGKIYGTTNLTFDAINEAHEGMKHKVIIAIDHSNGADGIIAKPEIKNFAQIKGKKVAFEHGTLEDFFTRYALEQHQLTLADIVPVDLNPEKAAEALVKGDVDVAVTYEPFLTKTVEQIHGNKIYSSADAPGLISDILTFRSDFIEQYPDTIQAIVNAYFRGISFWKEHPDEANTLIAKELGATKTETEKQLSGVNVLDQKDNVAAFTFTAGFDSLYGNLRKTDQFVSTQIQKNPLDTDKLVEPKFIKNLSN